MFSSVEPGLHATALWIHVLRLSQLGLLITARGGCARILAVAASIRVISDDRQPKRSIHWTHLPAEPLIVATIVVILRGCMVVRWFTDHAVRKPVIPCTIAHDRSPTLLKPCPAVLDVWIGFYNNALNCFEHLYLTLICFFILLCLNLSAIPRVCTLRLKNGPPLFCYNFDIRERNLIFLAGMLPTK